MSFSDAPGAQSSGHLTAMTDTPADPRHGTDSQDGPVGGTIEHLDPHRLELGISARPARYSGIRAGWSVANAFATARI